jgi:hypothetical protein
MSNKKSKNKSMWLRDGEEVLFTFRRHIISMRKGFLLFTVSFVLGSIPFFIWSDNLQMLLSPLIGLAVGLMFFSYYYILWHFTVYIVTNQRIRQQTQHSFFGSEVVELRLSKVQNISYNIPGFNGEMFHFGTIVIQTFVGDLVIHNVEKPEGIYNKLQDAVNNESESRRSDEDING